MGKKSVVFVAELSYMEKLEVALKSLCAHKGQWKIYVLNEMVYADESSPRGY